MCIENAQIDAQIAVPLIDVLSSQNHFGTAAFAGAWHHAIVVLAIGSFLKSWAPDHMDKPMGQRYSQEGSVHFTPNIERAYLKLAMIQPPYGHSTSNT